MRAYKDIVKHLFSVLIILIVFGFASQNANAQQDPIYSQYMNNLMSANPAYTGVRGVGSASIISRKQWLGLNGSPLSSSLTLSLPLDSLHVAAGFDFMHDEIGAFSTTALFFDYSYRVKASYNTKISFGLKAGFNYIQANLTKLDRYHLDDAYIIDFGDFTNWMPNFGVGVFWYGDNFYAGLSSPRLLRNEYNPEANVISTQSHEERHYFIHGAYIYNIAPKITFKPALTTIIVAGAPLTADFDFSFLFYDKLWLGTKYRISDAIGGYVQVQLDNFKIGFSYDYTHTGLSAFNNGTFEIMLRYDFRTKGTQIMPFLGF